MNKSHHLRGKPEVNRHNVLNCYETGILCHIKSKTTLLSLSTCNTTYFQSAQIGYFSNHAADQGNSVFVEEENHDDTTAEGINQNIVTSHN